MDVSVTQNLLISEAFITTSSSLSNWDHDFRCARGFLFASPLAN